MEKPDIDAAAKHLRETLQAGKKLTPWEKTPAATKKKWIALARGTLLVASSGRRIVPAFASEAMMDAGVAAARREQPNIDGLVGYVQIRAAYQAMLAAA